MGQVGQILTQFGNFNLRAGYLNLGIRYFLWGAVLSFSASVEELEDDLSRSLSLSSWRVLFHFYRVLRLVCF
jgi:hypothetical protein